MLPSACSGSLVLLGTHTGPLKHHPSINHRSWQLCVARARRMIPIVQMGAGPHLPLPLRRC